MGRKLGGLTLVLALIPTAGMAQSLCDSFPEGKSRHECLMRESVASDSPDCTLGKYWRTHLRTDPMTDRKTCAVAPSFETGVKDGLIVAVTPQGRSYGVLGESYPGTKQRIRVDKNPAVTVDETAGGVDMLTAQLKKGATVTTQYTSWPYRVQTNTTMPVCDLQEAIKQCEIEVGR